jgi:hypothetical protein
MRTYVSNLDLQTRLRTENETEYMLERELQLHFAMALLALRYACPCELALLPARVNNTLFPVWISRIHPLQLCAKRIANVTKQE